MAIYTDSPFASQLVSLAGATTEDITLYDNCHTLVVTFIDGGSAGDNVNIRWLRENSTLSSYYGSLRVEYQKLVSVVIKSRSKRPGAQGFQLQKTVGAGTYEVNVTQVCGNEV